MKNSKWKLAWCLAALFVGTALPVNAEEEQTDDLFMNGDMEYRSEESESLDFTTAGEAEIAFQANTSGSGSHEFAYSGAVERFEAPVDGVYTLEVWGGEGGASGMSPMGHQAAGGKGGYSRGDVTLKKGDVLFIAVGGSGSTGKQSDEETAGGFNGGGNAKAWKAETELGDGPGYVAMGSGGGATSIAFADGELRTLENNKDAVLIVAGGGGGGAAYIWEHEGGYGGGPQGGDGVNVSGEGEMTAGNGASRNGPGVFETSGGFGYGGSHAVYTGGQGPSTQDAGTGGGGGYYGGGGGYRYGVGGICGGGGSGYLGTLTNTAYENGVNSGNGKAKISWQETVTSHTVKISYLDRSDNHELSPAYQTTLTNGAAFEVTSPTVDGYLLFDDEDSVVSGIVSDNTDITVYYTRLEKPVKSVSDNLAEAGQMITYTVSFENPAKDTRTFLITDVVPEGIEVKEINQGGTLIDNVITWHMELAGNSSGEVSFSAAVTGSDTTIENSASLETDHIKVTSDPVFVHTADGPVKTVTNIEGVSLDQKLCSVDDVVVYRIAMRNPYAEAAEMVITDTLPEGLEIVSVSHDGTEEDGVITWHVRAEAESVTEVEVQAVLKKADTVYRNRAVVMIGGKQLQSNTTTVYVPADPHKAVKNEEGEEIDGNPVYLKEETFLIYEITLQNPSDREEEFTVQDVLPEGVIYISADEGGQYTDGIVTWTKYVPAHGTWKVTCKVLADAEFMDREFENKATVQSGMYVGSTNTVRNMLKENPDLITLEGEIVWEDENNIDRIRPNAVTVHVFAGDSEVRMIQVLADENGTMQFRVERLPQYSGGKQVAYTVVEDVPNGYRSYTGGTGYRFTIRNVHEPKKAETDPLPTDTPTPSAAPKPAGPTTQPVTVKEVKNDLHPIETVTPQAVDVPNTSDGSQLLKYFALCMVSLAVVIGAVISMRQRSLEDE